MLPEALAGSARARELELLVTGAGGGAAAGPRLAALAGAELDWGYVVRAATGHGVLPLLHRSLASYAGGAMPPEALVELAERRAVAARRSLLLTAALVEVLDTLAAREIDAVPFKGPLLATLLYGDVAMRPFADLDVLVRRREALAAIATLEAAGFRLTPAMRAGRRAAHLRCAWVWDFTLVRGPVTVELHWRLTAPHIGLPAEFDDLAPRLADVGLGGRSMRTLSTVDLTLYLCVHGAAHRWARLEWIADLAALLGRLAAADWGALHRRAAAIGARRAVALGLRLAHELFGVEAPTPAPFGGADEPHLRTLAAMVYERLSDELPDPSPGLALIPFHMRIRERLHDRARYLAVLAFAPSQLDLDAVALPPRLFALYFVLRPMRLLARRMSALVARLGRRRATGYPGPP